MPPGICGGYYLNDGDDVKGKTQLKKHN